MRRGAPATRHPRGGTLPTDDVSPGAQFPPQRCLSGQGGTQTSLPFRSRGLEAWSAKGERGENETSKRKKKGRTGEKAKEEKEAGLFGRRQSALVVIAILGYLIASSWICLVSRLLVGAGSYTHLTFHTQDLKSFVRRRGQPPIGAILNADSLAI